MSGPNPALVTQRGARRLPRLALWLLCAAYVLPGLIGRDPWRNADVHAFGLMVAMAEGRTSWWNPMLGGVPADTALVPHWLGAVFVAAGRGWLDPALAARVPFALLLALTLVAVWYSTYQLAKTEAAQPVAFAFGGEAEPVAYARAMADGGVLALMASLGLLQLGHETTPELAQLFATGMFLYALAAAPFHATAARVAVMTSLPLLAASGAPAMALGIGLGGWLVCARSRQDTVRAYAPWVVVATVVSVFLAWWMGAWRWRAVGLTLPMLPGLARQWLWFMWPAWPLALWTLWRWRHHLSYRHLSVPLVVVVVALATSLLTGGSDRALMLALPALAVLAAFALPTLKRSASAAIDWFSMCFFTLCALTIWVIYLSLQVGIPYTPAANVARLAPGFKASFAALPMVLALAGTLAWAWLVRWRSGRHQEALWKSLVLPASGVALCWLLLMTLWLPLLDYARSARPIVDRLAAHVPADACIAAPGIPAPMVAALEHFGRWRVDAREDAAEPAGRPACNYLIRVSRQRPAAAAPPGWDMLAEVRRPTDRQEYTQVMRRAR